MKELSYSIKKENGECVFVVNYDDHAAIVVELLGYCGLTHNTLEEFQRIAELRREYQGGKS